MIRVALVEDDIDLLDDVAFALRDEDLYVTTCSDGKMLDAQLACTEFDIVVLDIGLPGEDGLSIARRLRRNYPQLGIIMLTARTATRDRIQGMENGADFYFGKPVDLTELALVIRALARRVCVTGVFSVGALTLLVNEDVLLTSTKERISLTPSETMVLSRLGRATGRLASRRQIIEAFGASYLAYDERRLEAIVSRLRRKLDAAGLPVDTIRAVRGVGYMLQTSLVEQVMT